MEPPLQLKAAATASDTQALVSSKAWKVKLQQRGLYTGGKVRTSARRRTHFGLDSDAHTHGYVYMFRTALRRGLIGWLVGWWLASPSIQTSPPPSD